MKGQAHTADVIGTMWHDLLDKTLQVDFKTVQPVITTDGAANMVAASRDDRQWFWVWCVCHVINLAVEEA